jgi:hypothetical protein
MTRSVFTILSRIPCNSLEDLVEYWEQLYEDGKQHPDSVFLARLKWKGGKLTPNDIRHLFGWKYRPVPSWNPRPVLRRLRELNKLRFNEGPPVTEFAKVLSREGLVKRFFICHIISPRKYPIWDQYVLKAHLLISGREPEVDQASKLIQDETEYESYRTDFNRWVIQVPSKIRDSTEYPPFRRLDRALFAMGKYSRIVLHSREAQSIRT